MENNPQQIAERDTLYPILTMMAKTVMHMASTVEAIGNTLQAIHGAPAASAQRNAASFPPVAPEEPATEVASEAPKPAPKKAAAKAEKTEAPEPQATAQTAPATTASAADLTMIRTKIAEKAAEGKTKAIVDALAKYGAKNASTLAEENYTSFYNDLCAL